MLSTTVTLTGSAGNNAFLATLDAAGTSVQFYVNATPATGSPVQAVAVADLAGLTVDTGTGGADTLTLDTPRDRRPPSRPAGPAPSP